MMMIIYEMLKMGLWNRLLTQPLKYVVSIADHTSAVLRPKTFASPPRSPLRATEEDRYPLDVILSEQKPDHPSKMFTHAAVGHTRSFSTTASDRARRLPARGNPSATTQSKNSVLKTHTERPPSENNSKASKRLKKTSKKSTGRKFCRPGKVSLTTLDVDIKPQVMPSVSQARSRGPVSAHRNMPSLNCVSKSAKSRESKEIRPDWSEIVLRESRSLPSTLQTMKHQLWEKWILGEPDRGVAELKPERVDALRFPSYNYHYPAFKQRQLCQQIQRCTTQRHPDFRRVSVEQMRQLCECYRKENSLTATGSNKKQLLLGQGKYQTIPAKPAPVRPRLGAKEYARWRFETTPVVSTQARSEWNQFLTRCPERFDIHRPLENAANENKVYYDGGYALRFLRPLLTRGPDVERWPQKPLEAIQGPADISPFRTIKFAYI